LTITRSVPAGLRGDQQPLFKAAGNTVGGRGGSELDFDRFQVGPDGSGRDAKLSADPRTRKTVSQ
jgi:hypothetical protein